MQSDSCRNHCPGVNRDGETEMRARHTQRDTERHRGRGGQMPRECNAACIIVLAAVATPNHLSAAHPVPARSHTYPETGEPQYSAFCLGRSTAGTHTSHPVGLIQVGGRHSGGYTPGRGTGWRYGGTREDRGLRLSPDALRQFEKLGLFSPSIRRSPVRAGAIAISSRSSSGRLHCSTRRRETSESQCGQPCP
jgi:hypothetical protein